MNGKDKETLTFHPYLSVNEYSNLATALLAGAGIGDLPPIVQPELLRDGRLVEVMPKWHFRIFNLSVLHLESFCGSSGHRYIPRRCARVPGIPVQMASTFFPATPT
jgi:DNA-binding transcriptional LysR family regulator